MCNRHQPRETPITRCGGECGEEWLGWPEGVRASGTLSNGDGADDGQHCHAERSEASLCPARQTFAAAQGDTERVINRHQPKS